jgi:hypothetical protein
LYFFVSDRPLVAASNTSKNGDARNVR